MERLIRYGPPCLMCWCYVSTSFTALVLSVIVHEYAVRGWGYVNEHLGHILLTGPQ